MGENAEGNLLIGTPERAFYFGWKTTPGPKTFALSVIFRGKTYVALFGRGIAQIKGENRTLIFSNELPTSLYADGEKLWIGTANDGIFSFDGKAVAAEKSLEKLRGIPVWEIFGKGENGLWFAAERGLFSV